MTTPSEPVIASFGGGTNSTAMLIELTRRGTPPDAILFADTGGEKPHTYRFLETLSAWLQERGCPPIVTVRKAFKRYATLEENCLVNGTLPSIAFGFKTCSQKWKVRPQEEWARQWRPAVETWARGAKVVKLLGYDVGEAHRAKTASDDSYVYRHPLIEWGWDRDDCVRAIYEAGLPLPGKSACFFCPSSRAEEVRQLRHQYPELFERALEMERRAAPNLGQVKGLGRRWAWTEFARQDEAQGRLFEDVPEIPCGCYDGDAE